MGGGNVWGGTEKKRMGKKWGKILGIFGGGRGTTPRRRNLKKFGKKGVKTFAGKPQIDGEAKKKGLGAGGGRGGRGRDGWNCDREKQLTGKKRERGGKRGCVGDQDKGMEKVIIFRLVRGGVGDGVGFMMGFMGGGGGGGGFLLGKRPGWGAFHTDWGGVVWFFFISKDFVVNTWKC